MRDNWHIINCTYLSVQLNFVIRVLLWNHHHSQNDEYIYRPKLSFVPLCKPDLQPMSPLCPQATTHLLFITADWFAFFRIFYKWKHSICKLFVWLLSLSIMIFRFIHVIAIEYQFMCISSLFFFIYEYFLLARIEFFYPLMTLLMNF